MLARPGLRAILAALVVSLAACAAAPAKKPLTRAADLPVFTYPVSTPLEEVVRNDGRFAEFAKQYRRDLESVLAGYDIQDKATLRALLNSRVQLDYLDGRYAEALAGLDSVRDLQEKPADKLLSGVSLRAAIESQRAVGDRSSEAFKQGVGQRLSSALDKMPYAVVQNEVRELKASTEIASEALALGYIREVLQPVATKSGAVSSEFAPALINARYRLLLNLPLKQTLVTSYSDYLAKNKVEKADIWAARDVVLPASGPYTPVTIAIWDSGVDTDLYRDRTVKDAAGNPAVIAFDKYSNPSTGALYPIPENLRGRLPTMKSRAKGFSDLQSNIDSPEASEVKRFLSALKPDDYKAAIEELNLTGNYLHGTHVTGIAVAGNPYARLVTARIEFGHTLKPDPCPSAELAERDARANQAYVDFMKKNGVRVVNMSWGGDVAAFESDLELCGIGKDADERKALARRYFDAQRSGLVKAFSSAPEILFVTAAGNANTDSTFVESIPAGIVLPNLLTVGAVDLAGDEASFTSYGPTVKVHANGYQVESTIPGGERIAESGTSMASPQVAGLAGKILALNPKLTPPQVIAIIVSTSDKTPDGRRALINPKKALAAAAPK